MSKTIDQLRVAHHLALRVQFEDRLDASALVRTWPRVAAAALDTYHRLPRSERASDLVLERVALDAMSLGMAVQRHQWPGPGTSDLALTQVATALEAATKTAEALPMQTTDAEEAHRLLASSLWTTSQIISRSARDHGLDLRMDRKNLDQSRIRTAKLARDIGRRFNAVEQLTASSLRNQPFASVGGPARDLRNSVARWDVEAHRALLSHRSTAVLHVLAHQEAAAATAFEVFVERARKANILDPTTAERLRPVLGATATSWAQLRDSAAELSFSSTPIPMAFIDAGTDLREQFQSAIRLAGPEDNSEILGALTGHLASSVTISAATRNLIADGELRAPARAIARLSAQKYPELVESPVDPNAIHRGLSIPLTDRLRRVVDDQVANVIHDAHEAVDRTSGLDEFYRRVDPHTPPSTLSWSIRQTERMDPPPMTTRRETAELTP